MTTEVFADTVYWFGLINPRDPWHPSALRARETLSDVTVVTTEGVLAELLALAARPQTPVRHAAVELVVDLQLSNEYVILPQTHDLFQRGLDLYARRTASTLSLQDCISMLVMRDRNITGILTGDAEFRGFGFQLLLTR